MNLLTIFKRTPAPDISQAARQMRQRGIDKDRAKVRATCEAMNAAAGRPPIVWPS